MKARDDGAHNRNGRHDQKDIKLPAGDHATRHPTGTAKRSGARRTSSDRVVARPVEGTTSTAASPSGRREVVVDCMRALTLDETSSLMSVVRLERLDYWQEPGLEDEEGEVGQGSQNASAEPENVGSEAAEEGPRHEHEDGDGPVAATAVCRKFVKVRVSDMSSQVVDYGLSRKTTEDLRLTATPVLPPPFFTPPLRTAGAAGWHLPLCWPTCSSSSSP